MQIEFVRRGTWSAMADHAPLSAMPLSLMELFTINLSFELQFVDTELPQSVQL